MGAKGREIYHAVEMSDDDRKKPERIFNKIRAHIAPTLNPVFARYQFNNIVQGEKTMEQFITLVKNKAKDCDFGALKDDLVRDRIIFGVSSTKLREKLLQVGKDLKMDRCITMCQEFEYSVSQMKMFNKDTSQVHALSMSDNSKSRTYSRGNTQSRTVRQHGRTESRPEHTGNQQARGTCCGRCGGSHTEDQRCPAKGTQCRKCSKWNHWSKCCKNIKVNEITEDFGDSFSIDSVDRIRCENGQVFTDLQIGNQEKAVKIKCDTGSQVNILPLSVFHGLGIKAPLKKSKSQLTAYNGNILSSMGEITLRCKHLGTGLVKNVVFHIMDTKSPALLGCESCLDFKLIELAHSVQKGEKGAQDGENVLTRESILRDYSTVFDGIGLLPGECVIHVDPTVTPVVHPPRRIPVALEDKVRQELNRMHEMGVIAKCEQPTQWCNNLVVTQKSNGDIRLCLDPRSLNKAIKRTPYPLKTLDDVLHKFGNAKYFTKLDLTSAYWSIQLSDESSYLTAFNSPLGVFRYLRCPYGLNVSGDFLVRALEEALLGLEGVATIVDDLCVWGSTREIHDKNLKAVLDRAVTKGIRFNPKKLEVGVTEIAYFGHVLTSEGLKPDPAKIEAIKSLRPPTSKPELQVVLGMVNYLSRYVRDNLSEVTAPMRELLHNDVLFSWQKPQSESFEKMKECICKETVLAYYDPSKPLTLQVDSSSHAMGAVLLQDKRPIAFASRSLTESQRNMGQISKELLSCVFGLTKFHQYCYGRDVILENDHLPLVGLLQKPMHSIPPKLQRLVLKLSPYRFEFRHVGGKTIPLADGLSRNASPETSPDLTEGVDAHVCMVISSLPISDKKLEEIRLHTANDAQLCALEQTIQIGWPNMKKDCDLLVSPFWNYRDELTVVNGIIMKGEKIVIPRSLRSQMLKILHSSHLGAQKCLSRARSVMFWPGISNDIIEMVNQCQICLEHRSSQQKEPLISSEVPEYPFQIAGCDLFSIGETNYLVMADYYSRYPIVHELSNMKSSTVISHMKDIMSQWGICEKIMTDGGPCFVSQEFDEFAKSWNFEHVKCSPYHNQTNGLAEAMVKVAKRIIIKAKEDNSDPRIGFLEYRSTPLVDIGNYSPAQLALSRQLRSVLPTVTENLIPKVPSPDLVKQKISQSKARQKHYYDRDAKPLSPLKIGESARVQRSDKTWSPAIVLDNPTERSYIVETENGQIYRRNRRDLLKTSEPVVRHGALDSGCEGQVNDEILDPGTNQQLNSAEQSNVRSSHSGTNYVTRSGRVITPRVRLDL
jgi:hypothetical protein